MEVSPEQAGAPVLLETKQEVMQALTSDGRTLNLTYNAETGRYQTEEGEMVEVQEQQPERQQQEEPMEVQENILPEIVMPNPVEDTSHLSSLAAAAETHSTAAPKVIRLGVGNSPTNIHILNADGTLSGLVQAQQPQVKIVGKEEPSPQQIRVVNRDGTVSTLGQVRPSPGLQPEPTQQQQQIRIVKVESGALLQKQQLQQQQQQIRIVNADGSLSSLSGNIKVVSSNQIGPSTSGNKHIRVVRASSSPTSYQQRTTLTLAQAQQMGLIKSPVKQPQQVVIKGSMSGSSPVVRIPTPGSLQQVQVGNKVQYVKVVAPQQQQPSRGKVASPVTPILPATARLSSGGPTLGSSSAGIPLSALQGVKIALPPASATVQQAVPKEANQPMKGAHLISTDQGLQIKTENRNGGLSTASSAYDPPVAVKSDSMTEDPMLPAEIDPLPGVRPRKPCNCTKSQCLKLYCDCFANGEFCNNCNCNNCFNNLAHEEERQKAIKQCLDRNANAFKPKIGRTALDGERRHNKGCNCKRSGCLKNYCECYEAKIPCTDSCKCLGCKNIDEDSTGGRKKETLRSAMAAAAAAAVTNPSTLTEDKIAATAATASARSSLVRAKLLAMSPGSSKGSPVNQGFRQPFNFITPEVVEATCQCLLAQGEEAEKNRVNREVDTEALILEEFGRCLTQIIDMANKNKAAALVPS